jgi:hypothetical protein
LQEKSSIETMNNSIDSDQSYSTGVDEESHVEDGGSDRDEVEKVRKMSSKDTSRIVFFRVMVTLVLLLTAFVVTFVTYTFLTKQETKNFELAVSFSRRYSNMIWIELTLMYISHHDSLV